ncbi:MAG: class I SAM-dependent methyltransferase [Myxococcota bacterium]
MARPSWIERFLFARPSLYGVKRFLIEDVLWRGLLSGVFRMRAHPMPDGAALFRARDVLVAACGPGSPLTGPPVEGCARVTAFDRSPEFAARCARRRPDWQVYCGDLQSIPHADDRFEVSVLYSTLHHLPFDAGLALRELARVTRERIVVVEGVVPPRGLLRAALLSWYRLVDGGHHYYTLPELEGVCRELQLPIESQGLHSPIRHMWLAVLDCRGRREV